MEMPADASKLAAQFFTEGEAGALSRLCPSLVCRAFLTLWTRKEAVLKASGLGIGNGLAVPVPSVPIDGAETVLKVGLNETVLLHL
jgi:phosphopantetheinyl transferase